MGSKKTRRKYEVHSNANVIKVDQPFSKKFRGSSSAGFSQPKSYSVAQEKSLKNKKGNEDYSLRILSKKTKGAKRKVDKGKNAKFVRSCVTSKQASPMPKYGQKIKLDNSNKDAERKQQTTGDSIYKKYFLSRNFASKNPNPGEQSKGDDGIRKNYSTEVRGGKSEVGLKTKLNFTRNKYKKEKALKDENKLELMNLNKYLKSNFLRRKAALDDKAKFMAGKLDF